MAGRVLRLASWLLRLHPRRFRARYGAEIEAGLSRAAAEGASPWRLARDVLGTLVRSWADELPRPGRGAFRWAMPGGAGRELRHAARTLVRDPVHGAVAVLTLAFAIGANAAVFSVTHALLIRTLPYAAPDRTMRVEPGPVRISTEGFGVSGTLSELPHVEAVSAFTTGGAASLGSGSGAQPIRVTHVDGAFFETLGVRLELGRPAQVGTGLREAVIAYGLWRTAFGGDAGVVGRTIVLSGHSVVVAGVAPPEVDYPDRTELWLAYPLAFDLMGPAAGAEVIARLSRAELGAEVRDLHEARVREEWTAAGEALPERSRPELIPLRRSLVGPVGDSMVLLFSASGLVVVLGCVNLAGLILARNAGRRADFAMRRALGASRTRLAAMVMAESFIIAAVAAAPSVAFAYWGHAALVRQLPPGLPGLGGGGPGVETLAFVAAAAVVASLLIGAIPAASVWREGRDAPGTAGRLAERKRRIQPSLVIAQVALAVVLVVSAGLLGRSVLSLRAVPLGFDTDRVWTFEARLGWTGGRGPARESSPAEGWDETRFRAFARAVSDRLREDPDVMEVGVTSHLPLSDALGAAFRIWPAGADEDARMTAGTFSVSPGYFDAMGIRFLAGSAFRADAGGTGIVISRTVAQRLFGRANVVGEQVRTRYSMQQEPATRTITGVVEDLRPRGFLGEPGPAIYHSFDASPAPSMAFAVRTTAPASAVIDMVREAVMQADPSVAPFSIRSMRSAADRVIAERDALAIVSGLFAAVALLLAVLGIYGLMAQSVVRRRRELGIRIAVGARPRDLLLMVLRGSALLVSAGIAIGLLASLGATRLLARFLFGIGSTDPPTFAAVAGIVLLVAAAATLGPAGRAAAADPVTSLRE